jgi:integrase
MAQQEPSPGALVIRAHKERPFYEAKWRDSRRTQCKRRLGPAWLERDADGSWSKPRSRVREGFLDERRAYIAMAAAIERREEELLQAQSTPEGSFDQAVSEWLEHLEHEKRAKPSTMADYRLMLAQPQQRSRSEVRQRGARIMRAFGGRELAGIDGADVRRFLAKLDREDISARTVNKHRQVLHAIFEYAARSETFGLAQNPAAETSKRPEGGAKPIETFEPSEVEAIASAARAGLHRPRPDHDYSAETKAEWRRINEQDAALFIIAAFTGLRMGELLALRWSDVDLSSSLVTVSRAMSGGKEESTKSRRFRPVPLAGQPASELKRLSRRQHFTGPDDLIFCRSDGGPLDRTAVRRRFVRAQQKGGVKVRRFHDLRHTFGSLAIREFDVVAVKEMMGHSKLTTTERYLHSRPRKDDAAKLTSAFGVSDVEE